MLLQMDGQADGTTDRTKFIGPFGRAGILQKDAFKCVSKLNIGGSSSAEVKWL